MCEDCNAELAWRFANQDKTIAGSIDEFMAQLDGSVEAAVSLLTGFTVDELNDLGGFKE